MRQFKTEGEAAQHAREFGLLMGRVLANTGEWLVGERAELSPTCDYIAVPPDGPRTPLQVKILALLREGATMATVDYAEIAQRLGCERFMVADTARRWQSLWLQ